MITKESKDNYKLEDYLSMPYKSMIYSTGEAGNTAFFAEILELEGCCAEGTTPAEAYDALKVEMAIHLQMYLNKGIAPPLPKPAKKHNVKVLVRMPASLQHRLAMTAKAENMSINQLIINKLSSTQL